jgi:hypothetical protein
MVCVLINSAAKIMFFCDIDNILREKKASPPEKVAGGMMGYMVRLLLGSFSPWRIFSEEIFCIVPDFSYLCTQKQNRQYNGSKTTTRHRLL